MGRLPERIYFSREFDHESYHGAKRFAYQVYEDEERPEFADVEGELVLRISPSGTQQTKAIFLVDNRQVARLMIQKFWTENGAPTGKTLLSLSTVEVAKLTRLLDSVRTVVFEHADKMRIDAGDLADFAITESALRELVSGRPDLLASIVETELTTEDVTCLAYRKKQLEEFERLLQDDVYFDAEAEQVGKPEAVWQAFFERNHWILGHGLTYIFSDSFSGKKLEQVTAGFSVTGFGKRVDALLKTRGFVSALCFGELKTHRTGLTAVIPRRPGVWSPTADLTAGVAQVQKTVQKAIEHIRKKLEPVDASGAPTGEVAFVYKPKSVLVIGSLQEFKQGDRLHEERYASFELFRRSLDGPEIVTFDELLERAKNVVHGTDHHRNTEA